MVYKDILLLVRYSVRSLAQWQLLARSYFWVNSGRQKRGGQRSLAGCRPRGCESRTWPATTQQPQLWIRWVISIAWAWVSYMCKRFVLSGQEQEKAFTRLGNSAFLITPGIHKVIMISTLMSIEQLNKYLLGRNGLNRFAGGDTLSLINGV